MCWARVEGFITRETNATVLDLNTHCLWRWSNWLNLNIKVHTSIWTIMCSSRSHSHSFPVAFRCRRTDLYLLVWLWHSNDIQLLRSTLAVLLNCCRDDIIMISFCHNCYRKLHSTGFDLPRFLRVWGRLLQLQGAGVDYWHLFGTSLDE